MTESIHLVRDQEALVNISTKAKELIVGDSIDQPIFNSSIKEVLVFKTLNLFEKESYAQFVDFQLEIGEEEFYYCPTDILSIDVSDYLNSVRLMGEVGDVFLSPIYRLTKELEFNDFNHIQCQIYFSSIEAFLISHSGLWVVYGDPNLDLMLLGLTESVLNVGKSSFASEDILTTFEEFWNHIENNFVTNERKTELMEKYKQLFESGFSL